MSARKFATLAFCVLDAAARETKMSLQKFTVTCLLICVMSFFSLLICISTVADRTQLEEWLLASVVAFFGTFVCISSLQRTEGTLPPDAKAAEMNDTSFTRFAVSGSFWVPIGLCLFGILAIQDCGISFPRVAWILVVLSGNTGLSAARLRQLHRSS